MSSRILKHFDYSHLPECLQRASKPIGVLARILDESIPDCDEKAEGLRKLLEARDCFVRALIDTKR